MKAVHGTRLPDLSRSSLRAGVGTVLEPYRSAFDGDSPSVVVPDVHYPHHPSTGLVTDPNVVSEVVRLLSAEPVRIAIPGSELIDAERAAQYLGYDRIAREQNAEIVYLPEAERIERTVHLTRRSVTVSVAKPLLDDVVNLPTIRRSASFGLEAGMANLGWAIDDSPDAATIRAANHVCSPAVNIVDGTRVYTGEPYEARALLACDNGVATSIAAADLLGVDRETVPHLDSYESDSNAPVDIRGFDSDSLAETMPQTEPKASGNSETMAAMYRLYARLAGDLVPPQMFPGGGSDG